MLRLAVLAGSVAAQIMAAPSQVSPQTQAIIAPVAGAIAEARRAQAALPPAASDAERLIRLGELDQAPRRALGKVDMSKIPAAERKNASAAIWQLIIPLDQANLAALLAMLPKDGWFTKRAYGPGAAKAAFHIVQHADPDTWRRFVPVLEPLAARGEIDGGDFAAMYDRLAVSEHRPQRYGTQFHCEAGKWTPDPVEDLGRVEALRAQLQMTSFAATVADFADDPPC